MFMEKSNTAMNTDQEWCKKVEQESGINVSACYQCKKCTNGCPVTFAMDIFPDNVIRLVQMGQKEAVLSCSTIWICSGCETCTTRCPNEVDVAGIMDYLKEEAIQTAHEIPAPKTYAFHKVFLDEIKRRGRISEGGLMARYMLESGELRKKIDDKTIKNDILLGWEMFKKGRMNLLSKRVKNRKEIREIFE